MKPCDLARLAVAIYGPRWVSELARDAGKPRRTIQRWARARELRASALDVLYGTLLTRYQKNRKAAVVELRRLQRQALDAGVKRRRRRERDAPAAQERRYAPLVRQARI